MKKLILLLALGLVACSKESADICTESPTINDSRPDILVIGDSISLGYMPHLQAAISTKDFVHNTCNAMNSRNGVMNIDKWLAQRDQWEMITFNHGLWDAADFARVYDEEYAYNIRKIALKIKAATPRPVFILTTEVPAGTPYRENGRVLAYNNIATTIMNELGIPVIDLYTESLTAEHSAPMDVHYTDNGSLQLANKILTDVNLIYGNF